MMKKIIIFITLLLCSLGLWAQSTIKTNLTIQKATPILYLNGTSAAINFYNSDITLTQSSNLLTLGGGDLSLGVNSLLMTGSIGTTLARITKGWLTNLEITNLPTISGVSFKTALSLTAADVSLGNVTNESKSTMFTSPTFTGIIPRFGSPVSDTLATRSYARTYGGVGVVTIGDVRDEIADSLNVLRPSYVAEADTSAMLNHYILASEVETSYVGTADSASMLTKYARLNSPAFTGTPTVATYLLPDNDDGASLGMSTRAFSDLYLAPSGAIVWDNALHDVFLYNIDSTMYLNNTNGVIIDGNGTLGTLASKIKKGWFTDLNITNVPTISTTDTVSTKAYARSVGSGAAFVRIADTASMLIPYINRADTATMLINYINKADTSAMLSPYALLSEMVDTTFMEARIDSIVAVLADTANIETLYADRLRYGYDSHKSLCTVSWRWRCYR